MGFTKQAYLSLGGNLGHRYAMLQKAVFRLQERAGNIVAVSPVYETPAWGFEGGDFLNVCVALATELSPMALLRVVLQIETELGRKRSDQPGYQSRMLDIDLIFYENEVIHTPELVIPHPRMHQRNFVLKPLADIAPQLYHPLFHKDIRNILQQCKDRSHLKKIKPRLFTDRLAFFSQFHHIAIEGNIGAGKTTLAQRIAHDFKAKLVLERSADNPFLPKFYKDQPRYAFPLEMSFLADRYQQFMEEVSQPHRGKEFIISDYDISKSLVFAKITLLAEEFKLYKRIFDFMYKNAKKPDLYIYLCQDTAQLRENLKKRGRRYEQDIKVSYLKKVNTEYLEFVRERFQQNSVVIDLSGLDFVNRSADYEKILEQLEDHILAANF